MEIVRVSAATCHVEAHVDCENFHGTRETSIQKVVGFQTTQKNSANNNAGRVKNESRSLAGGHAYNPIRDFGRDSWRDCLEQKVSPTVLPKLGETFGKTVSETFRAKNSRRESLIGLYA